MLLQKFKESAAIAVTVMVLTGATMMIAGAAVQADGNDSPANCETTVKYDVDESKLEGDGTVSEGGVDKVVYNAPADRIIDGVCIKSGNNAFDDKQHSTLIETDGAVNVCYNVTGIGTQTVTVERTGDCKDISHVDVVVADDEDDNNGDVDYCDPSQKPGGQSIADWVPTDERCVEVAVEAVCGALNGGITTNDTPYNYGVSWSEGSADYNYNTSLPAEFSEDYNNGSVEVFYWVVGEEADYVTSRNIPNYWEQNAESETVDTDCVDNEDDGGDDEDDNGDNGDDQDDNGDDTSDDDGEVLGDDDERTEDEEEADNQGQVLATSTGPETIANTGAGAIGNILFPILASLPAVPFFKNREE